MTDHGDNPHRALKRPLWQRLLLVPILLPLYLLGFVFVIFILLPSVLIIAPFWTVWIRWRFRSGMSAINRRLSRNECIRRLQRGEGTLIFDSPVFFHGSSHAWWTPDDVNKLATARMGPGRTVDWNDRELLHWILRDYVSLQGGRAMLVASHCGKRFIEEFADGVPKSFLVVTSTGDIEADNAQRAFEDEQRALSSEPRSPDG